MSGDRPRPGVAIDVAIVGAGVAGCAASMTLARTGIASLTISPPTAAGDRFGESLSPAATPLLDDLGLGAAFAAEPHRRAGAWFAAWGTPALLARSPGPHLGAVGHALDRPRFDRMLTDAAARAGAARTIDRVRAAHRADGGWLLELAGGPPVRARFVIDASGRAAVVARRQTTVRRIDRLVAAYGFLVQRDPDIEPTPAAMVESMPGGWWYAALLPDRRLALGLFTDADRLPRDLPGNAATWREAAGRTRFVARWLESAGFSIGEPPRVASAGTAWLDAAAGDGWAAAGDAAAAFDPLSSHGIASALWMGRQAALAAAAALAGDPAPLDRYAATVRGATATFLAQRSAVYARERRFADQPFWRRRTTA